MTIEHLKVECSESLQMLKAALESMDDVLYAQEQEAIYNSSIGLHVRHVLDHFDRFICGFPEGLVDYDSRLRERELELNRRYAIDRIDRVLEQLAQLPAEDCDLQVIMDLQYDQVSQTLQRTSLARELAFLHSHATHHYATLAFMFKALDLDIEFDQFGLAPGTVRHKRGLQCAP